MTSVTSQIFVRKYLLSLTTRASILLCLGVAPFSTTAFGDEPDESYVNLIERLDAVERKLGGQTSSGEDIASQEDFESVRNQIKELRGRIEELEHALKNQSKSPWPVSSPEHGETQDNPVLSSKVSLATEKKNISPEADSLDDVINGLEGLEETGPKSTSFVPEKDSKIDNVRDRATQNAEKSAPTDSLDVNRASDQYDKAVALYTKGEYAEAEEGFRYYLEMAKDGKMAHQAKLKVALCQLEVGKEKNNQAMAKKSVKEFAELYKAKPKGTDGAEALLGLAESVTLTGDTKKACLVSKKIMSDFSSQKGIIEKTKGLMKKNKCA